jgi:hypothetical protein
MYKFLDLIHCQRDGYVLDLVIEDETFLVSPKDALSELENIGAEFKSAIKMDINDEDPEYETYVIYAKLFTQDIFETLMMLENEDWNVPMSEPECRCESCGVRNFNGPH